MASSSLKCLIIIVDRGKGGRVCKLLTQHGIVLQYVALAHGTAHSVFIDYLGLAEPEKEIVFSIAEAGSLPSIFQALKEKMQLDIPGKGIAFTVPLNSLTKTALDKTKTRKDETLVEDTTQAYELVAALSESGYTELVIDAARKAGARGGTVLNARSMCPEDVKRILGYTIQSEKELILLLTPKAERKAIMQAMCDRIRQETGEGAIAFSLPVCEVAGLVR